MKKLLVLSGLLLGLSGASQASFNKPLHDYCEAIGELSAITLQSRNEMSLEWPYVSSVLLQKGVDGTTYNLYKHVYSIPRASGVGVLRIQMLTIKLDIYNMCMNGDL